MFVFTNKSDLSLFLFVFLLQVGDIITQVESVDEQWILVVVGGKRGIVPKNYISLLWRGNPETNNEGGGAIKYLWISAAALVEAPPPVNNTTNRFPVLLTRPNAHARGGVGATVQCISEKKKRTLQFPDSF